MKGIDFLYFIVGQFIACQAATNLWGGAAGWFTAGCCIMFLVAVSSLCDTRRPTASVASGS